MKARQPSNSMRVKPASVGSPLFESPLSPVKQTAERMAKANNTVTSTIPVKGKYDTLPLPHSTDMQIKPYSKVTSKYEHGQLQEAAKYPFVGDIASGIARFNEGVYSAADKVTMGTIPWLKTAIESNKDAQEVREQYSRQEAQKNPAMNIASKVVGGAYAMIPDILMGEVIGASKLVGMGGKAIKGLTPAEKALFVGKKVGENTANTSTARALDALTGAERQALKGQATRLSMSSREGILGYDKAKEKGASTPQALAYGVGEGALQYATESISGLGMPFMGRGSLDNAIEGVIKKTIKKPALQALAKYGIGAIGEGGEEVVAGLAEPWLQRATYDKNAPLNYDTLGEQFIVGAGVSILLGAPATISDMRYQKKYGKQMEEMQRLNYVEASRSAAIMPQDSKSYQIFTEINQEIANDDNYIPTKEQINNLHSAVISEMSHYAENQPEIYASIIDIAKQQNEFAKNGDISSMLSLEYKPLSNVGVEDGQGQSLAHTVQSAPGMQTQQGDVISPSTNNMTPLEQPQEQAINSTANDIQSAFNVMGEGVKKRGFIRNLDIASKEGYVAFNNPDAVNVMENTPIYKDWTKIETNGETRFEPPTELLQTYQEGNLDVDKYFEMRNTSSADVGVGSSDNNRLYTKTMWKKSASATLANTNEGATHAIDVQNDRSGVSPTDISIPQSNNNINEDLQAQNSDITSLTNTAGAVGRLNRLYAMQAKPYRFEESEYNSEKATNDEKTSLNDDKTSFVALAKEIGKAFGVEVAIIKGANKASGELFNGVYHRGTIYINEQAENATHVVLGHELFHHMEDIDPALAQRLKNFIEKNIQFNSPLFKKYIDALGRAEYELNGGMTTEKLTSEITGDFMGEMFNEPAQFEAIFQDEPTLAQRILDFFKRIFENMRSTINQSYKVTEFLNNKEAVIEEWQGVLKEYRARNGNLQALQSNTRADYSTKREEKNFFLDKDGNINNPSYNELVNKTDVEIAKITGSEITGNRPKDATITQLRNEAWKYIHEKNLLKDAYFNKDTNMEIGFYKDGFEKIFSRRGIQYIKIIPALPIMVKNAVWINTDKPRKVEKGLEYVHTFYAPVEIGEMLGIAKMQVKQFVDRNGLYNIQANKIEAFDVKLAGELANNGITPTSKASKISISQLLNEVNNFDDESFKKYLPKDINSEVEKKSTDIDTTTPQNNPDIRYSAKRVVYEPTYEEIINKPDVKITVVEPIKNILLYRSMTNEQYKTAYNNTVTNLKNLPWFGRELVNGDKEYSKIYGELKGRVTISTLKKGRSYNLHSIEQIKIMPYLDKIFENAVVINSKEDEGGSREISKIVTLLSAIKFGKRDLVIIKLNVKEYSHPEQKNKIHENRILEIIELDISTGTTLQTNGQLGNTAISSSTISVTQMFDIVKNNGDIKDYLPNNIEKIEGVQKVPNVDRIVQSKNVVNGVNKNNSFSQQIDKWLIGEMRSSDYFDLGETPVVLRKLGAKNLPVIMTQDVMSKITGEKHDISLDELKTLPDAIADPIMVFKSSTVDNAFVMLTEIQDKQGRDVVVAVHLDKTENYNKINRIASVYGRNNINNFVLSEIDKGNLKYINKNKSEIWLRSRGLQLPKQHTIFALNNNILQESDIVNTNIHKSGENDTPSYSAKRKTDVAQFDEIMPIFDNVKDWNKISENLTNIDRVIEGLVGKDADKVFEALGLNESDRLNALFVKEYNKYVNLLKSLNIKYGSGEEKLVQMVGEGKIPLRHLKSRLQLALYNNEDTKLKIDMDKFYATNGVERVTKAVEELRKAYKELLVRQNEVLVRNGYPPIKERKNYFFHTMEDENMLAYFGLNFSSMELPTAIAGITRTFSPGRQDAAHTKKRWTDNSDNMALRNFERYVKASLGIIYYTDTVQKLRGFEKALRWHFSTVSSEIDYKVAMASLESSFKIASKNVRVDVLKEQMEEIKKEVGGLPKGYNKDQIAFGEVMDDIEKINKLLDNPKKIKEIKADIAELRKKVIKLPANLNPSNFETMEDVEEYFDKKFKMQKELGNKHLNNFTTLIHEYANQYAGKTADLDRGNEGFFGRWALAWATFARARVAAHLLGANVATATTQLIPITQTAGVVRKSSVLRALLDTMAGLFQNDGVMDRSDFAIAREGVTPFAQNWYEKTEEKAAVFSKLADKFTTAVVVRAFYYEGVNKKGYVMHDGTEFKHNLSSEEAIKQADKWAKKVMAGRGHGDMPVAFKSKTFNIIGQFQLEVLNNLQFQKMDMPKIARNKGALWYMYAMTAVFAYLFNNAFEWLFGRRPAPDIIGIAERAYKDYTNKNLPANRANVNLATNVLNQIPFASMLTGGRVPITIAIPDLYGAFTGKVEWQDEAWKGFVVVPGGNQIKKTITAINALRIGGSYTDDGKLRFSIEATPENILRAPLGGIYATTEGHRYVQEADKILSKEDTKAYKRYISMGLSKERAYGIITMESARASELKDALGKFDPDDVGKSVETYTKAVDAMPVKYGTVLEGTETEIFRDKDSKTSVTVDSSKKELILSEAEYKQYLKEFNSLVKEKMQRKMNVRNFDTLSDELRQKNFESVISATNAEVRKNFFERYKGNINKFK